MHGQVMLPLTSTSDKLTIDLHKTCLPSKAGLVCVSKTSGLREVRNVSCSRYHWMELFGVTPVPHYFSSVRNRWPASGSAALAPPLYLCLLVFPPSKWASIGKHTTPGALFPVPCLGAHPQCARQEARASRVLDNSSSHKR